MEQKKIKVLIVDDSFFMRKLLHEILSRDEQIEIVEMAKNGAEAVALALKFQPDVITMDFNMPIMNGVEAVTEILALPLKRLPAILMISAYTKEGSLTTINALAAGAVDFIEKPSGEFSLNIEKIAGKIIRKVKNAAKAQVKAVVVCKGRNTQAVSVHIGAVSKVLVIGASTGGPPLIEYILTQLPLNLNIAVLVVQHMPKYFTASFAERLNQLCAVKVKEAAEGDVLENGVVYVAPGDSDLTLVREKNTDNVGFAFEKTADVHGLHPSIDKAMRSVAAAFGENSLAMILSGMGDDGTIGAKAIKDAGGYVVAQELATATIDSMPHSVIQRNYQNCILTLDDMVKKIYEFNES